MAGFSGSATADAVAVGSVLIPAMKEAGYPPEFTTGITAASSCIGPIIPPSIAMVIYGAITGLSIGSMFMGGFIPGISIGLGLMFIVHLYARKNNWPKGEKPTLSKVFAAIKGALFALIAPLIIIGGIVTGVATATEAGVIAVVYAFIIGVFVYREISIRHIPKLLTNAAINTAVPVLIISCASIFGWVLARENFASAVTNLLFGITTDTNILYFLIVCMLMLIGLFVEGTAAMIIFVPILFPIGGELGYDPIHFALVIIITILIGTITPPVGLQLYIASSISRVPISRVTIWPFVAIMVAILLLITYVPPLVTYLPYLVFGNG
jgi:C4-dicarboxylate transporter DctM subunit